MLHSQTSCCVGQERCSGVSSNVPSLRNLLKVPSIVLNISGSLTKMGNWQRYAKMDMGRTLHSQRSWTCALPKALSGTPETSRLSVDPSQLLRNLREQRVLLKGELIFESHQMVDAFSFHFQSTRRCAGEHVSQRSSKSQLLRNRRKLGFLEMVDFRIRSNIVRVYFQKS